MIAPVDKADKHQFIQVIKRDDLPANVLVLKIIPRKLMDYLPAGKLPLLQEDAEHFGGQLNEALAAMLAITEPSASAVEKIQKEGTPPLVVLDFSQVGDVNSAILAPIIAANTNIRKPAVGGEIEMVAIGQNFDRKLTEMHLQSVINATTDSLDDWAKKFKTPGTPPMGG
ncbi:MAG: hypothetical protein SFX19_04045 [Alphaproteobacteria bacterium]|nr:hypothetical protein [Alphaproteobacteria bacterium]